MAMVLVFPTVMLGDQIMLKNGDRLTGSIVKSDDKAACDQDRVRW
jgi:hypothetical protein